MEGTPKRSRKLHSTRRLVDAKIGPVHSPLRRLQRLQTEERSRQPMDALPDRSLARWSLARLLAAWLVAWSTFVASAPAQQPPPDATWIADAAMDIEQSITDMGLGAIQGVV